MARFPQINELFGLNPATIRPNACLLIARVYGFSSPRSSKLPGRPPFRTPQDPKHMTKRQLTLLATTAALTAMQLAATPSHAQSAPIVVAQAKEELGPDRKPKQQPKE